MLKGILTALLSVVAIVALVIGAAALAAFPAMLIIGILHGYNPEVPAIGLWNTWAWLALVGIVGSRFNSKEAN